MVDKNLNNDIVGPLNIFQWIGLFQVLRNLVSKAFLAIATCSSIATCYYCCHRPGFFLPSRVGLVLLLLLRNPSTTTGGSFMPRCFFHHCHLLRAFVATDQCQIARAIACCTTTTDTFWFWANRATVACFFSVHPASVNHLAFDDDDDYCLLKSPGL